MRIRLRKSLCLFIFSIVTGYNAFPATYYPMLNKTAHWDYLTGGLAVFLQVGDVKTTRYFIQGDTMLYGHTYSKVYSTSDSLYQHATLCKLIRESQAERKVWSMDPAGEEQLLYDFSLNTGEHLTFYGKFNLPCDYVLRGTDSVRIGSEYHKVFVFDDDQWIEGIGSVKSLFYQDLQGICGMFSELLCYSNSQAAYTAPKFKTCWKTNFTPQITTRVLPDATVLKPYFFKIETSEIYPGDSIRFISFTGLPEGLKLDSVQGILSGIPLKAESATINICVTNQGYVTDFIIEPFQIQDPVLIPSVSPERRCNVFPNPARNELNFDIPSCLLPCAINILDQKGILVRSFESALPRMSINISTFSEGSYFAVIQQKSSKQVISVLHFLKSIF